MLLCIHLFFAAFFVALGALFFRGKGAWLIAGYNTQSAAQKQKYDEKALCRCTGKLMFALAACWLVIASSEALGRVELLFAGIALVLVVVVAAVIYMNTGNRFQKK